MKTIRVGLIGWGTVGGGVVKILKSNGALIARRLGARLILSRVADIDLKRKRDIALPAAVLTTDALGIVRDPEIDLVVELIGGLSPAHEYISEALRSGKHVVTANKALLAERGEELFSIAARSGRRIFFEASVGGGIPIIKSLREGLAANRIESVLGIINGTSNYVLSRMSEEGESLPAALSEAQQKGYAEPDPSLDLNGTDSAHKLVILAALAFGGWVKFRDVYIEGIGKIGREDIAYTGDLGYAIKLLAIAKRASPGIEVRVHPTLLPRQHLLASVGGAYNAISIEGDYCGQNIFIGLGAGQGPAASAVVADLVDAGRDVLTDHCSRAGWIAPGGRMPVAAFGELECSHYLRIPVVDRPGVLAKISSILARHNISIVSVIQRGRRKKGVVPVILMTHRAKEKELQKAVAKIDRLDIVRGACLRLRAEH